MRVANGLTARSVSGRIPRRHRRTAQGWSQDSPPWLQQAAGWSWRLIIVAVALALIGFVFMKLEELFVALFIALIFTSVLRPLVGFLDRYMPRPIATVLAILGTFLTVAGIIAYIVISISSQWNDLSRRFVQGLQQIQVWIESVKWPFHLTNQSVTEWANARLDDAIRWITSNSGLIANQVVSSLGSVIIVLTTLIIAFFCSIFFINSGGRMWIWFLAQIPKGPRPRWQLAGESAWESFAGYTRGIFIVAATNGMLAGLFLALLGVPLFAPLGVLVFLGTFVPLIGAPTVMLVAALVALAANGPMTAFFVVVGIALIGQFEGHVLQPFVMGKQVDLHPVIVIIAVTAGTLLIGVLGAVISVPIVAVSWSVFDALRPPLDEELPDPKPKKPDLISRLLGRVPATLQQSS